MEGMREKEEERWGKEEEKRWGKEEEKRRGKGEEKREGKGRNPKLGPWLYYVTVYISVSQIASYSLHSALFLNRALWANRVPFGTGPISV